MANIRVIVTEDGDVQLFGDEGSYEELKPKLEALATALGLEIPFSEVGDVENHRHGSEHLHVGQHTHAGHQSK